MADSYEEIVARIKLATTTWSSMTAYERTRMFCQELVVQGRELPNWQKIRDCIEKGSSRDIQDAINDVHAEQRSRLAMMSKLGIDGVPDALAPHILATWTAAKALAAASLEERVQEWQQAMEVAKTAQAEAMRQQEEAVQRLRELEAKCTGLEAANVALHGQVNTERATREQAERMVQASRQDLEGQRESMREELARSQKEVAAAISRLEDIESRAHLAMDVVRQEAKAKVEALELRIKGMTAEHTIEVHRLVQQANDWKSRCVVVEKELSQLQARFVVSATSGGRQRFPKRGLNHKTRIS